MKIKLIASVVVLSAASLAVSAEELSSSFSWGDVTFQPRAYVGYADYELKGEGLSNITFTYSDGSTTSYRDTALFDLFSRDNRHDKLPFSGLIGGIGGTMAYGQFFGDLYYQSTANITAYSGANVQGIDNQISFNENLGDVDAQHSDWAISLGYAITDQWSVFAGYKSGNTEWDQTSQRDYPPSHSNLWTITRKFNGKFYQDGPFVGTSYSFLIGPGVLTFKAAYAYLDGTQETNEENVYIYRDPPESRTAQWKLDGNSNAYSLGVLWTQSLADNLGLSLGANYHNYSFDMSGTASTATLQNYPGSLSSIQISGANLTESLFTFTAALVYRF